MSKWDLQVWNGNKKQSTPLINVDYAIAALKKKQLIAQGIYARNIWIVKHK